MASNGYSGHNGANNFLVLYKVMNTESDKDDPCFNAFSMPRGGRAPNLATVKQNCAALYGLNSVGPEGYHWRVCVEDKPPPGATTTERSYSWWDVQDENATLPVKEATQNELRKFFSPKKESASSTDAATIAAKGAFKSLGKAMSSAVSGGGADGSDGGPTIPVIAFKLLDLTKMHDDFSHKNMGRGGKIPQSTSTAAQPHAAPRTASRQPQQQQSHRPQQQQQQPKQQHSRHHQPPSTATKATPQQPYRSAAQQPPKTASVPQRQQQVPRQPAAEPSLLDFGASPDPAAHSNGSRSFNHSNSFPNANKQRPPPSNESRAEKLKREYAQKAQSSSRVWDDIDQRWVDKDQPDNQRAVSSSSASPGPKGTKAVGISLDPSNAIGKSANVQAAVNKRVNEMREQQAKALQEVREREEKKKSADAEEDVVRKVIEPKIKAWSEDHGQKKHLRALLASLHTVLWPGTTWKPISIGDVLNDSKLKKFYHKATLVVHPDKTHSLDAEKRFLAKRIFDALTQAKTEFDNGAK